MAEKGPDDAEKTRYLESVRKVPELLSSSPNLAEVLDKVIEQGLAVMNAEAGTVWLDDRRARGNILPFVAIGPRVDGIADLRLHPGEGLAGQVVATGKPILVNDVTLDPAWASRFDEQTGYTTKSILCVPLTAKGETFGCFQFINKLTPGESFTAHDLKIGLAFASQAALAIHNHYFSPPNAQLPPDPTGKSAQELEKKIRYLESLQKVTVLLSSSLNLEEVLDNVIEQGLAVMGAEAGTVWLIDRDTEDILPFVAIGPRAEGIKGLRLRRGEGIAGKVVSTGESLLISDVTKDPAWASRFDEQTGFVTRSILCVPLTAKDETIGCFQMINKRSPNEFFTTQDLELGLAFASQAALVIHNSYLFTANEQLLLSLIETLSATLDARDPYTAGHSQRVSEYGLIAAQAMQLDVLQQDMVRKAGLLHDIGKIGIRDNVLLNPSPLDPPSLATMRTHPSLGAEIVGQMKPSWLLREVVAGILYHQERWNGRGYPTGLRGEEIPLAARILAVADSFDAITTDRPYRQGKDTEAGLAEIERCAGTDFDPRVVEAFVRGMRSHRE